MTAMSELEYRARKDLELRCPHGEMRELIGYASTFNSPYEVDGMIETISPVAFTRTLREKPDVFALIGHDTSRVVGRTTNGSLSLSTDAQGLRVSIKPVDTQEGRDLVTLVRTGTLDSMSFGFIVRDDEIEMRNGMVHRSITDLDLHEVSVVAMPANSQARISARAKTRADALIGKHRSENAIERARRLLIVPLRYMNGENTWH